MKLEDLPVGPPEDELSALLRTLKENVGAGLEVSVDDVMKFSTNPLFEGAKTLKVEDFNSDGRLNDHVLEDLREAGDTLFEKHKSTVPVFAKLDATKWPVLKVTVMAWILNVLQEKLKKEIVGKKIYSVDLNAKSLIDFEIKVVEEVDAKESPNPEKSPDGKNPDGTEVVNNVASEKEQEAIKAALKGAGVLGWIASMFIFKKGENGEESFIGKAYKDPNSFQASILGFLGLGGPGGVFKKAADSAVEGLPPQAGGILASLEKMAKPCREGIQKALGNVGEAVVKGLGVTEFMDRLKNGDEEFKSGLKNELVVGEKPWEIDGNAKISLPADGVLKFPPKHKYMVWETVGGELKSNTPDEAFELKGAGEDNSLVIALLPPGTIIPVGSKIISLMKEEPAVA